ncbi:hypothetical protein FQA47_011963 [Oryzias melastigma]|uniref:Uncharacterized protein n=1 Tax=Oryzias melastigma TaxID=30732 RepID=A0A834CHN4_ORYME|nr:hypothetical protein FQA47_011963 [Oryzias melastigma]
MKDAGQKTAAARHSDKTLQIVSFRKELSCRNRLEGGGQRGQPEHCVPPRTLHIYRLAFSFFSPCQCPNSTRKPCIPHVNAGTGAVCVNHIGNLLQGLLCK